MWTISNLCVLYIERNLTRKIKNIRPMKSLPDWSVQDLWYQISCRSVVLQNPSRWFLHTYKYIGNTVIRYSFTDKLLLKYHESRSFGSICNICLGCRITPTYTMFKDIKKRFKVHLPIFHSDYNLSGEIFVGRNNSSGELFISFQKIRHFRPTNFRPIR